jgi:hypothetical protein
MPLRIATFLVTASLFAQIPHLTPRVIMPGDSVGPSFWLLAPQIIVVSVKSANWLGPAIEITPPQRAVVRLVRVDGEVENIIQGELPKGPIQFYFFANTTSKDGYTTIKYWLTPGRRYVVFLREEAGVLRTMADLAPPKIQVLSGRHDQIATGKSPSDLGRAILHIALTPTGDYDKVFASGIQQTVSSILEFVAPSDLARSLRILLTHPDRAIQDQACLTIAREFRYRDPCLPKLLNANDPAIQQQARLWMQGRQESGHELLTLLRDNPLALSASGKVEDLASDLETFTWDWDAEVRKQACATLRRLFPAGRPTNCTTP